MAAGTSAPEIDGLDELAAELESDGLLQQPEQVRGHEQTLAADSASHDQAADDGSGDEFEHILPRQPAPSAPLTTEERPAQQPEPGAETTDEPEPEPEIEAAEPAATDATDAETTLGSHEEDELEIALPEAAVEESGDVANAAVPRSNLLEDYHHLGLAWMLCYLALLASSF